MRKKQGLRGAAIGGSVLGEEFADQKFHPVWAKAEELGAVLFIHPQSTPELANRFKGNGIRSSCRLGLEQSMNATIPGKRSSGVVPFNQKLLPFGR